MSKTLSYEDLALVKALRAELAAMSAGFQNLEEMSDILGADVKKSIEIAKSQEEDDAANRAVVRAAFAWVEGIIFSMKLMAQKISAHRGNFSTAELAMLEESSYDLNDNGRVQVQQKFIPLSKNIKFAFEACARAFGITFTLDLSTGWESFLHSIKVRNRITHPRTVEDLHLSENDIDKLNAATAWFGAQHRVLITAFITRLRKLDATTFAEAQQVSENTD